jgi:hypothetical protein
MRHITLTITSVLALLASIFALSISALAQETIEMEGVPLSDAIRNLAAQLDINYILDPRICRHGYLASNPPINARWNLTAQQALQKVLSEHSLVMVSNAATSVAFIKGTNTTAKFPSLKQTLADTNAPIELLKIDTTLDKAIEEIADRIYRSVNVDAKLRIADISGETRAEDCDLWLKWRNIKPRQALTALLDNYDLMLVEGTNNSSARIMTKAQYDVEHTSGAKKEQQ